MEWVYSKEYGLVFKSITNWVVTTGQISLIYKGK